MTNDEKIKKIQALIDSKTPRLEHYYKLFEEMGDIEYKYTEYVESNVDKEIRRLPNADYHMCCCLMTLIFREDYFMNGKFKERYDSGMVTDVLKRMILLLKGEDDKRSELKEKKMKISRLQEVDIRKLWAHEQYDFSAWLAKEENIELLNEKIGLTLVDINTEAYVGSYRCDIVAVDETTGIRVIIENQLENSNHDHLGKIITYASGLDAKVIVWIVKEARDEHRSAIEWLNNNTVQDINFFLIELHAYQIGNSDYAPMFQIVEQPNDFIKEQKGKKSTDTMNKSQSERLEFWTQFNDHVINRGKPFPIRKAGTAHWYDVSIGTSEAKISIALVNKDSFISVELYIYDNKALFDKLYEEHDYIQKELGFDLNWYRLENSKASRIQSKIDGLNFDDHSNYDHLIEEAIDKVLKMREVFKNRLK
ncbi:DUF4268 domain-containing protein [Ruminococcus flavefaciens]|uniref:DUF4268 domain-containing protein n=1 Tax=Ruminococcus flavefaciens TaxID=1265 RepID=UPI0026E9D4A5|nr:DUF4268 domain-containing protein [Ruminococcus flavefaciens]